MYPGPRLASSEQANRLDAQKNCPPIRRSDNSYTSHFGQRVDSQTAGRSGEKSSIENGVALDDGPILSPRVQSPTATTSKPSMGVCSNARDLTNMKIKMLNDRAETGV